MLDSVLTNNAPEIALIPANYKRNFQRRGFLWRNSISVHENTAIGKPGERALRWQSF